MSAEDCLPLDIRLSLDLEPLQSLFIFIFSIVEQSMDEEGETGGVAKKRPLRQRRRRVLSPLDRWRQLLSPPPNNASKGIPSIRSDGTVTSFSPEDCHRHLDHRSSSLNSETFPPI